MLFGFDVQQEQQHRPPAGSYRHVTPSAGNLTARALM
jgi:hypothetical protein